MHFDLGQDRLIAWGDALWVIGAGEERTGQDASQEGRSTAPGVFDAHELVAQDARSVRRGGRSMTRSLAGAGPSQSTWPKKSSLYGSANASMLTSSSDTSFRPGHGGTGRPATRTT